MTFPVHELLHVPFNFKRRPRALPPDLRPDLRVAVLVLVLARCRAERASLRQLHVLMWAVRSRTSRSAFLAALQKGAESDRAMVRFEPSVNRTLDLAVGEGLVERVMNRVILTDKGRIFCRELHSNAALLDEVKAFLDDIGKKVTQKMVEDVLSWGHRR